MRHKRLRLSAVLLLGLGLTTLQAQEAVTATGGDASGSGGTVSYSVGQVAYQTQTGTNGSVAEGVQQPYEISAVTGIEEAEGIHLSVTAYPNPTTDYLTLEVKDFELSTLHFQLFNMNGKLLQTKKLTGIETQIDMNSYVPSTYFVKVYAVGRNDRTGVISGSQPIKEFKIIKQ
ncbi:MAG: T9SS type A sorting domain-containing protein [Prolixibacteraceae bacterium]|jgi:hypothetical protein|nr:T9SS type A sorting domain-containing protein [Prolixibacteraceae bacterium]